MKENQLRKYRKIYHEIISNFATSIVSSQKNEYLIQGKRGKHLKVNMCLQLNIFGEADVYLLVEGYGLFDEHSFNKLIPNKKIA